MPGIDAANITSRLKELSAQVEDKLNLYKTKTEVKFEVTESANDNTFLLDDLIVHTDMQEIYKQIYQSSNSLFFKE